MHFLELLSSDEKVKAALEQSYGQIISLNHAPPPANDMGNDARILKNTVTQDGEQQAS